MGKYEEEMANTIIWNRNWKQTCDKYRQFIFAF